MEHPARAGRWPQVTGLSLPLSVLDLAVVGVGSSPAQALANSTDLARTTEALGYHRYWVAEHHNMPGIASSSPPVLLAHLGAATSTMRLGSGGVMLPNHAPLVVAEQFGMLEALHPGRIDLGHRPGARHRPAHRPGAAPVGGRPLGADDFPEQFSDLVRFFDGSFPDDHPYRSVTAVPGHGYRPAIWLLGSSDYSAQVAGLLGCRSPSPTTSPAATPWPALAAYRRRFRPSDDARASPT